MFALVEFSDNSRVIYPLKRITKRIGNSCIVKHGGCKYEAKIIALNETRQNLELFDVSIDVIEQNAINNNTFVIENDGKSNVGKSDVNTSYSSELDIPDSHIDVNTNLPNDVVYSEVMNNSDASLWMQGQFQNSDANVSDYKSDSQLTKEDTEMLFSSTPEDIGNEISTTVDGSNTELTVQQSEFISKLLLDMPSHSKSYSDANVSDYMSDSLLTKEDTGILFSSTPEDIGNEISTTVDGSNTELTDQQSEYTSKILLNMPSHSKAVNENESSDLENEDPNYEPQESDDSDSMSDIESITHQRSNQGQNGSTDLPRRSLHDSYGMNISASTNIPGQSACDDDTLSVRKSRGRSGDKKPNFCFYCHKKQCKIARHLELKHIDEEDVKKFVDLPKKSIERRKIIEIIRNKGNFLFNTVTSLNDGELIVSRRPSSKFDRSARDFKPCANCKAFYAKSSLRVHFRKCTKRSSKKHRVVMVMSKKVLGRIHSRASDTVRKELFPPLREDDVVRLIRYDELVIIYANKMCEKYKNPRFHEMIRQRMRLIGRFLLTMRKLNKEVTDLTSVYDPKFCDDILKAINIEARLNDASKNYEAPTVASSLGTLLKQIGTMIINECIKKHDDSRKKNAEDFLKLLAEELSININRTVVESQTQQSRRKKIELPSMEDIKKLHTYLSEKRNEAFLDLEGEFSEQAWMNLAETTLTSIQLFNRRRDGEVERILIDDFKSHQGIDQNTDKDLFKSLSRQSQEVAKKYVRFAIRGKLNRTVPVLLDTYLLQCIELLLIHRKDMRVSDKNPYVFGVRGGDKSRHNYLRACILMRKFSSECGATYPERLRGTKLRKHIATTCISLNLSQHEVADLANFMGHAEQIHKDIYRQPLINREILRMSKLLEVAQGANEEGNNDDDYDTDEDDELENSSNETSNASFSQQERYAERNETLTHKDITQSSRKRDIGTVKKNMKRKRCTSPYGSVKRTPWNAEEKETVLRLFGKNLKNMKLPSLKEIHQAIVQNPCLKNRSSPQIKTWLHNQTRAKKKLSFQE